MKSIRKYASGYLLASALAVLLMGACAYLPFERVDYKVYPTAENPSDFYGRVYTRTRVEEAKVHPVSSPDQASQEVGFPVLLPAYLPDGFIPVDKIIITQSHGYQIDIDLNIARTLLDSANLPTDRLPTGTEQIKVDAIVPTNALTFQEADQYYVTIIRTRTPAYEPPSGIDPALLDELGKLGWQSLGLTQDQAAQLVQRMNWAFFLALPPAGMQSAEMIEINGIPGVALNNNWSNNQDRAILWEVDGVLYGLYSDLPLSELLRIAASLE